MKAKATRQFRRAHYETIGDVIAARVAFMRDAYKSASNESYRNQYLQRLFEIALGARDMSEMFGRDNEGFKPAVFAKRCGFTDKFEAVSSEILTGYTVPR